MNVSIKTKFSFMIVFMIVVSMLFAYVISTEVIYRNFNNRFEENIKDRQELFDSYIRSLEIEITEFAKLISENEEIVNHFSIGTIKNEITKKFSNILDRKNSNFDPVKLFEYNKEDLTEIFGDLSRYDNRRLDKDFSTNTFLNAYENGSIWISTYTLVWDSSGEEILGAIELKALVKPEYILLIKDKANVDFLILDNNDTIQYSTITGIKGIKIEEKKDIILNGTSYRLVFKPFKDANQEDAHHYFITAFDKTNLIENIREISAYLFISLLFVFSIVYVISNTILNILVDSIKELTIKINSIREGDFDVELKNLKSKNDEIGILAQDFESLVNILKNKIEQLQIANTNKQENSEKLEYANQTLGLAKKELEQKNKNIDRVNKMLNNRISEISNLYYLVINVSKFITDEKFYSTIVKSIREGLHIKKVILFEKEGRELVLKSKIGIMNFQEKIHINEDEIDGIIENEISLINELGNCNLYEFFSCPYIVPLAYERNSHTKEDFFGILIIDDGERITDDIKKSISTYAKTIILAFNNRKYYLKMMEEITKLEKMTKRLKESEHLKNVFMANISHELKIPLVPIKGYTEMILSGNIGGVNGTQRKGLITSMNNIMRLEIIIENLLIYSRIESGEYRLVKRSFDLVKLLNRIVIIFERMAERKNITIIKNYSQNNNICNADEDSISMVLINLISNALKFSKDESNILINVNELSNKYEVVISDNGVGMGEQQIDSIFKSFKQLEEGDTRKYGGIGLGLTIAKKVLEYHGEDILIQSRLGVGTTVRFNIDKE